MLSETVPYALYKESQTTVCHGGVRACERFCKKRGKSSGLCDLSFICKCY